jgi:hypothetical protein
MIVGGRERLTWGQAGLSFHKRGSQSMENLKVSSQKGRQSLNIVHTCEEQASIFPELFSSSTFDMATQPSFWKDELATDQTRLFTDSIAD